MNIKDKIPDGWEVFSFGNKELVNIIDGDRGKNYPKEKDFFDEGYCLFLNTKNVTNRGFNFNTNKYITKEKDNSLRSGKLNRYDIVMTTRGTIGNCGFYDDFVKYDNIRINSGMVIFRVISDKIFQKYLYMFLTSNIMREQILSCTTGTAQPQLPIWTINKLYFFLPPLSEQKRIASILSALDDKIELNNKTNKILEEMAQTIFKEWFINFNFPNEYGKPYKKSGGEMIDSELGKIPKGWKVGTIGDIAREVICGKTPPTKDKENYGSYMPFITIPDMHNNIYVVKTERYLSKKGVNTQSKKTIPKNSICVSCIATVGVVSLVSEYSQTNQQINSIIPKGKVSSYWVYFYIKNIKDMIINYASSGTTTLNLNKSQFEKIKIIIPSDNLFMSFNEIAKSLFDMIINNQIENEKLSNIRDSLLPKLMTPKGRRADGEIRV